jgi:hypothetical protein
VAAFLAELADQVAIGGVDPQRNLGAIIGQGVNRWQARPSENQGDAQQGKRRKGCAGEDGERQEYPAQHDKGRTNERAGIIVQPRLKFLRGAVARMLISKEN